MLTPSSLPTKAKQIKSIGLVDISQNLKVTKIGGPH